MCYCIVWGFIVEFVEIKYLIHTFQYLERYFIWK